nr:hypothetical protein [Candidatus Mycobacterium methanotrophicum]
MPATTTSLTERGDSRPVADLAARTRRFFNSLPRSGTVRAVRLLAEIGDCRARFPTPEPLAGLVL